MGVPDFVEESLISYEFGDLGPLFYIKMATRGPHFDGSPFSLDTDEPGSRCSISSNLSYQ